MTTSVALLPPSFLLVGFHLGVDALTLTSAVQHPDYDDDSELGLRGSEDESPEGIDILNILLWYRCVFQLYSLVLLYIT